MGSGNWNLCHCSWWFWCMVRFRNHCRGRNIILGIKWHRDDSVHSLTQLFPLVPSVAICVMRESSSWQLKPLLDLRYLVLSAILGFSPWQAEDWLAHMAPAKPHILPQTCLTIKLRQENWKQTLQLQHGNNLRRTHWNSRWLEAVEQQLVESMSFLQLFVICQTNFCFYVLMYSELFYSVFDILQYSKVCTCLIKTDVHLIK